MSTQYARVVRWSIALTSVVAAVAVVLCAVLGGTKGAYGALIGVGVVTAFFAISIVVVGRAARVSPMAMMVAALATFLGKIVAFMIVLAILRHSTAFNGQDARFHRARLHPRLVGVAGHHLDEAQHALRRA